MSATLLGFALPPLLPSGCNMPFLFPSLSLFRSSGRAAERSLVAVDLQSNPIQSRCPSRHLYCTTYFHAPSMIACPCRLSAHKGLGSRRLPVRRSPHRANCHREGFPLITREGMVCALRTPLSVLRLPWASQECPCLDITKSPTLWRLLWK
jgi:hypothetical protein